MFHSCSSESLDLRQNKLYGEIPTTLYQPGIQVLHIGANGDMQGTLPSLIGNMLSLRIFGLGPSKMSGQIPDILYTLPNLTEIDFSQCAFTGGISDSLKLLNGTLVRLYLDGNNLSGPLPEASMATLGKLEQITIQNNDLTGSIPQAMCERRGLLGGQLQTLNLDCNIDCNCCNSECVAN